jgi:hypothetical protein
MDDAAGKARHCTLMLLAAAVLADCAPKAVQQRALARYSFLYADAGLLWLRRWRNALKRDRTSARRAKDAKPSVDRLASALAGTDDVRDYLAAKRQSLADGRADDIEATLRLWSAVNPENVQAISSAALEAHGALDDSTEDGALVNQLGLSAGRRRAIAAALPDRDPDHWYIAADTAADLRSHTLAVAQGGELGRRIAQINDVAEHLDVLLRIAPVVEDLLPYDWLVRSAIVLELNSLLDLALGPPPGGAVKVMFPLIDLCRAARDKEAADRLEEVRSSIGEGGWIYVRWMRNKICAHIDDELPLFHLQRHLVELDYEGVVGLAEYLLDRLDELGATQIGLKLLLLGERKIRSWPTDPAKPAPGRPKGDAIPGALARLFRTVDSPYMIASSSSNASGLVAGISAGRAPRPRARVAVRRRPDPATEPGRWISLDDWHQWMRAT